MHYMRRWTVAAAALAGLAGPVAASHATTPEYYSPILHHGALHVQGTPGSDRIALRLKAGDPAILQVDLNDDGTAEFSFARADVRSIDIAAGAGDDSVRIDEANGVFTDTIPTTISGGSGNDRILGGSGAETIRGGSGNDSVDAGRGNDVVLLGRGDDSFVWNPGEGSDTVEGRSGTDTMVFNGANVNEGIHLSASGHRLELTRDVANITMDVERRGAGRPEHARRRRRRHGR